MRSVLVVMMLFGCAQPARQTFEPCVVLSGAEAQPLFAADDEIVAIPSGFDLAIPPTETGQRLLCPDTARERPRCNALGLAECHLEVIYDEEQPTVAVISLVSREFTENEFRAYQLFGASCDGAFEIARAPDRVSDGVIDDVEIEVRAPNCEVTLLIETFDERNDAELVIKSVASDN